MTTDELVLEELLLRYETTQEQGLQVTLEEIGKDHPHLIPRLRREIELLKRVDSEVNSQTIATGKEETVALKRKTRPANGSVGRYRPQGLLGQGALGEVLLATDTELHRQVALKRLRHTNTAGDGRERFLVEALITGRLDHPGVVPVHGLVYDDQQNPHYAMRRIRGENLDAAIARFHRQHPAGSASAEAATELQALLRSFLAVCQTIAFAHSEGFLHRDLKPENVMVGRYGETLVVDWGLAKRIHSSGDAADLERTSVAAPEQDAALDRQISSLNHSIQGHRKGSPAYMSPEQAAGRWDEVGPASDVYSLGATLYKLLTGQLPFRDPKRVFQQIAAGEYPKPRELRADIPFGLEAICLKAMALRPEDRYRSADELAADIERWLADEPVLAAPEPFTMRAARWLKRHQTAVVTSIAVLIMAALGLGAYGAVQREHNDQLQAANDALKLAQDDLQKKNADLEKAQGELRHKNQELTDALAREKEARDKEERSYTTAKQSLLGITRQVLGSPQMTSVQLTPLQLDLLKGVTKAYDDLRAIRPQDRGLRHEGVLVRLVAAQRPIMAGDWTTVNEGLRAVRPEIESLFADSPDEMNTRYLYAELHATDGIRLLQDPNAATPQARETARQAFQTARTHLEAIIASKKPLKFDSSLVEIINPVACELALLSTFELTLAQLEGDTQARDAALRRLELDLRKIDAEIDADPTHRDVLLQGYGLLAQFALDAYSNMQEWEKVANLADEAAQRLKSRLSDEISPLQFAQFTAQLDYLRGKGLGEQEKYEEAVKALNASAARFRLLIRHDTDLAWVTDERAHLRMQLIDTLTNLAAYSLLQEKLDRAVARSAIAEARKLVLETARRFGTPEVVQVLDGRLEELDALSKNADKE